MKGRWLVAPLDQVRAARGKGDGCPAPGAGRVFRDPRLDHGTAMLLVQSKLHFHPEPLQIGLCNTLTVP